VHVNKNGSIWFINSNEILKYLATHMTEQFIGYSYIIKKYDAIQKTILEEHALK